MMIYQFFALAFLIVTPIASQQLITLFKLDRKGLKFADLALPLFALEMVLVSKKFLTHSILPHYLLIMSLLSLGVCIWLLRHTRNKRFSHHRFTKLYWRLGFFVTFFVYVALLVAIFVL